MKRKLPYGLLAVSFALIMICMYLTSGIYNIEGVTILNLDEALMYSFKHPLSAYNEKTPAFLTIGLVIWLGVLAYCIQFYRNFHENAFGSDTWRDVKKANKKYKDKKEENNRIISQNLKISLEKGLSNNNMAVIASSGSYKTTGLVEQNLLQFGSSYIVLDVKGELRRKWGNAFLKHGYDLKTLDFKTPRKSDQYNPFVGIETEADVLRIGATVLDACRPKKENSAQDPFWDDAVLLYTQSLFFAAWLEAREFGKIGTMNRVMELAMMESQKLGTDPDTKRPITALQKYMDELAERYGADYPPVRDYRKLKEGAPDTVGSVVLMFNGMLNICNTAEVRRIFEGNDFNLRDIGRGVGGDPKKKTVVFLCIPDDNPVYNWIVSVFYTQCISILTRLSDDEIGGPLPIRVEFWMDEFYAGCRPANVEKLLGIIRGRNMSMILILQSLAQIEDLYPGAKWKVIMDNLAVVLFMGSGPGATDTHEAVSKMLGNETIDLQNDTANFGQSSSSGMNFSQQKRELMTPTEVKRLSTKEALIFIEASQPIKDLKAIPFDTKDGEYTAPRWLKKRYFSNLAYGEYVHPVETFYDAEHFHYITIKRDEPFRIYTDEKDTLLLCKEAERNESIYEYTIKEDDLLYLSWGKGELSKERIQKLYDEAMKDEEIKLNQMKGLLVLQNMDVSNFGMQETTEAIIDKSTWSQYRNLKDLVTAHWEDLSEEEQEEISQAVDDGLYEHQIYNIMLASFNQMKRMRQAYMLENRAG